MFRSLKTKGKIDEKQLKYFTYEYKKTYNLGKLHLLPKIYKSLYDVPRRPIIPNCGTPTEKISEFFDRQLKPIMQKSWSYIKDSGDFIRKIKNLRRICSFETDFVKRKNEMKSWFLKRGYPEKLINNETKKVKFNHYHLIGKHNSKKGIPLVVTYHPLLKIILKLTVYHYLKL